MKKPPKSNNTKQKADIRSLVNSDSWTKRLDVFLNEYVTVNEEFFDNKWVPSVYNNFFNEWFISRSLTEKIGHVIEELLNRTISEIELNRMIYYVQERFQLIHEIKKIQEVFNVPEDSILSKYIIIDNKIDLVSTLEPLINYFRPEINNPENIYILIRLKKFGIVKEWLKTVICNPDISENYFRKYLNYIFLQCLNADIRFFDYIKIPNHLNKVITYQSLYKFLFQGLIGCNSELKTVNLVWSCIDHSHKIEVISDTLETTRNIKISLKFLHSILPENWTDNDIYRSLCFKAYINAFKNEELTAELIKEFSVLFTKDVKLLTKALIESSKISESYFIEVFNNFLHHLGISKLSEFISKSVFQLFWLEIGYDNADILEKIWKSLCKENKQAIINMLNDGVYRIIASYPYWDNGSIVKFIAPKLTEENKQSLIDSCIFANILNSDLVEYLFPMANETTRLSLLGHFKGKRPTLYDPCWYYYIVTPKLSEMYAQINHGNKSISCLFGNDYANEFNASYKPIFQYITLLRETPDEIQQNWKKLKPEDKRQLAGPILMCLFNNTDYYFNTNRIFGILYDNISHDEIVYTENDLLDHIDEISVTKAFVYWIRKYASTHFIEALKKDSIMKLLKYGYHSDDMQLIAKIFNAIEKNRNFDLHLNELFLENYVLQSFKWLFHENLTINGVGLQPDKLHLSNALDKLAGWLTELMKSPDQLSANKIHKFTTLMIKCYRDMMTNKPVGISKTKVTCRLVCELLSDRQNNPILVADDNNLETRFFELKNPIDGQCCQSKGEKIIISLFYQLRSLYPKYFSN